MESGNADGWEFLRQYTGARIALGRAGTSIRTKDLLEFQWAHALARDAVHEELDTEKLTVGLSPFFSSISVLQSKVSSKTEFLHRPDLGRRLSDESKVQWNGYVSSKEFDIQIIVADGLSSRAVHRHVIPLLDCFLGKIPSSFTFAPLAIVRYGRVAISDEIGEISRSKLSIILLGERPGLSAPDSLGIYLTYRPAVGLTDESRNCISNIRGGGLLYDLAADKLVYLSMEAIRLKLSGVGLKENDQLLNN